MELAYGLAYLLLCGVIVVVGAPFVLIAQKVFGENEGRDEGIWTVIVFAVLMASWIYFG